MLKIILFASMFSMGGRMAAQWELLAPLDTTWGNLYTKFFNDSTGIVASIWYSEFQLMKTWDYGNTWDTIHTDSDWSSDLFFSSESIGYRCSYNQPILKTIDGGYTWFNPCSDIDQEFVLHKLFFVNDIVGFGIFTGGGTSYAETLDGGLNWTEVNNTTLGGNDIFALDDCKRFVADTHWIHYIIDCENDWNYQPYALGPATSFYGHSLYFLDEQNGLICGDWNPEPNFLGAFVAKTNDGGITWEAVALHDSMYDYSCFEFVNGQVGYCGGYGAQSVPHSLLKTTDGGNSWGWQEAEIFPTFIPGYGYPQFGVTSISCPSADTCYAVGNNGAIWRTFNGGGDIYELPVSVQELTTNPTVKVYPNPAQTSITFEGIKTPIKECVVYDNTGRVVLSENNLQSNTLNVEKLKSGLYHVSVKVGEQYLQVRFVKE